MSGAHKMAVDARAAMGPNGKENCGNGMMAHFDGIYAAPIDRLGPPGRWIRHSLLGAILASSNLVSQLQATRRPWLDKLMRFLSFLGTEEFYTPIVVLLEWVIDTRLARLFTILMGVGFYFTTFMKNILRMPRPPSPPVTVLETTYDWSLPSLHAIIGVMLPWYICLYMYQHYQLLPHEIFIMISLTSFWSTSVSVSRVYLGVHSPADIICGIIPGTIMLITYLNIDDALDSFITTGSYIPLKTFMFYAFMLGIHPNSGSPTHSYGETVICNSVAYGFIVGTTRTVSGDNFHSALMEQVEKAGMRTSPTAQLFMLGVARILIGFPLVMLIRMIVKSFSKMSIRKLCKKFNIYSYSYSEYRKTTVQLNKHHTSGFILPPIWTKDKEEDEVLEEDHASNGACNGHNDNGSFTNGTSTNGSSGYTTNGCSTPVTATTPDSLLKNDDMPLDIDNPTKFVTYIAMSWFATEWVHVCFHWLGLHMIGR